MVDLSVHQTSLDEVDGFEAQVADCSHPGVGRALDGQRELCFLARAILDSQRVANAADALMLQVYVL